MSNLKAKRSALLKRATEIVAGAKEDVRELTQEEQTEFDSLVEEIKEVSDKIQKIEKCLESKLSEISEEPEEEAPEKSEEPEESEESEESPTEKPESIEKRYKNNSNNIIKKMKNQNSITKLVRSAINNGSRSFTINVEKRASVTGGTPVDNTIPELLEPLYANSVLSSLGVRFYSGLPMGDLTIPVMGEGNVGWAEEIAEAGKSDNKFTSVVLKPKRLTAYVDISKQLINQDTYGVEDALRRDIVNALSAKLEATIFGDGAKSDTQPAGIFDGVVPATISDFKALCNNEATVENKNVYGDMKYLLSPSAKAALRAMAKSTKNTQLVYEGGEVDGVPALTTSNVPDTKLVYGNFQNLAVASWGNIDVTVDEYSQAVNGCIRLVVNAYFDSAILRKDAFAFGTIA